jgi:hypothetical protein
MVIVSRAYGAPEWDGRFSTRTVYSTDNGVVERQILISYIDVDLLGKNLTDSGLELELDSTLIWDDTEANERRFGRTESIQRIREANLSHRFMGSSLKLSAGRILIPESGNAWVDGANAEVEVTKGTRLGLYGGLRPLPLTFAPSTDYQTTGTYFKYRDGSRLELDGGYNLVFRGGLDRQSVFQRSHFRPNKVLSIFNYMTFEASDSPDFSTLLAGVHLKPNKRVTVSLNASRYSVEQYRNTVIYQNVIEPNQILLLGGEVVDLVYNRIRLSVSSRFKRRYYVYQLLELKHRSQDGRQGALYTTGVRDDDLWGLSLDLRGTIERGYQSDTWILAYQLNGDVGRYLSWQTHGTIVDSRTIDRYTERGRTFDEAQRIYLLGGLVNTRIARLHILSLAYDAIVETELQDARNQNALLVHTGMFRYQMRF